MYDNEYAYYNGYDDNDDDDDDDNSDGTSKDADELHTLLPLFTELVTLTNTTVSAQESGGQRCVCVDVLCVMNVQLVYLVRQLEVKVVATVPMAL